MAKRSSSIKTELRRIVRRKIDASYLSELGIEFGFKEKPSILQAIALAQVKKGLEGDLKAAMFIEEVLGGSEAELSSGCDVVVRVLGEDDAN